MTSPSGASTLPAGPGPRLPVARRRLSSAAESLCRAALPGDAPRPPGPKDELLDAVWPETAVSDAVVRVAIGALRKVLGDTAQTPRYIATVPRRGYRFLAPVAEYTGTAPVPQLPSLRLTTRLSSPASRAEAERRRLTVLFCDLVDSTTLAGHLDPEDLREVVRAYHQTCAEVMQRFDGYIAQYLGDGVLVYFGYPVAHEDDAQRAVWTGLGMLEALDALNTRLALPPGERVAVRLGVHTGLVVVGDVWAGGASGAPGAGGDAQYCGAAAASGGAQYAGDLRRDVSAHRGLFHV